MFDHFDRSEGLAAIYPAMMNSIFALIALGYSPCHPLTARRIDEFSRFEIEDCETLRLQPCLSPVWDTAIAFFALMEANVSPADPGLQKTIRWLLENQILGGGDWQIKNPDAAPGGWAFEFRNDFYPDVDDTAFVLMALQNTSYTDQPRLAEASSLVWTGWSACKTGTVDGEHSIATTIVRSLITSHSRITTPCWIRRRQT